MAEHTLAAMAIGALIGRAAADRRGFSPIGGTLCGALMGPAFAWLLFAVDGIVRPNERERCGLCGEWMRAGATICAHCGRNGPLVPHPAEPGSRLRLIYTRRD
jgi:hypothetical protein